jgi:photosystem I protein
MLGEKPMTAQASHQPSKNQPGSEVAKSGGNPPYPFRTAISLFLLAGNFLVAAIYFHLVNP